MIKKDKIGIIGLGFVGNAVKQSYIDNLMVELIEIDIDPTKNCKGTFEDLKDADAVFICVPSPMNIDGSCDTSPLIETMNKLKGFTGVIISKVTAPPDTYDQLQKEFSNLVYAPEFLTAINAVSDYLRSNYIIVGGKVKAFLNEANRIIKLGLKNAKSTYFCSIQEASLVKYTVNTFLATKVIFMNEMQKLSHASNQNWETIRNLVLLDERIGNTHTQVPGPDGFYGFGGACFPKDTAALSNYAKTLNIKMNVLDSAIEKNNLLRDEK